MSIPNHNPQHVDTTFLRVIREDASPPYDANQRRESRHVTMIEDSVVERVAETCGLTGLGLYCYLERRVNRDANWTSSMVELAAVFQCSVRHIRDSCKALEDHGFVTRTPVNGRTGMTVGTRFHLPLHPRTYRAEVGAEVGAEPNPELGAEPNPELGAELSCARDVLSNLSNSSSSVVTPPLSPKGERKRATRLSDDFAITPFSLFESMCDEAGHDVSEIIGKARDRQLRAAKQLVDSGATTEDIRREYRWLSGQSWITSGVDMQLLMGQWSKWVMSGKPDRSESPIKPNGRHPHPTNKFGERIYGTEELLRMAEEMEGKTNDESGDCQDALDAAFRVVPR